MGLVLKCTFRAKRSTKNGQIDFKTVLNDPISGHATFIVINFGKINWVNFLMSFFWKFKFLTRFSKSKNNFISVLVGG